VAARPPLAHLPLREAAREATLDIGWGRALRAAALGAAVFAAAAVGGLERALAPSAQL
jgi:hypothetical protein